jgi:hypothetical protein
MVGPAGSGSPLEWRVGRSRRQRLSRVFVREPWSLPVPISQSVTNMARWCVCLSVCLPGVRLQAYALGGVAVVVLWRTHTDFVQGK